MRKYYQRVLKEHFHKYLIKVKEKHNYKQAEMAAMLAMDDRSFADLKKAESLRAARLHLRCF